jgi:glycosyltransferase involved in cell wall biosynthesis
MEDNRSIGENAMRSSPVARSVSQEKPLLVIVPSVVAARGSDGWIFDEKAISGLYLYQRLWPGRVRCVFREGRRPALNFGRPYSLEHLPFEVRVLPPEASVPDELISDGSIVLASGDNWRDFPIADQGTRLGVPVCFIIEYTLETRLQILALSDGSLYAKAKSLIWHLKTEGQRRRAFSKSSGIQSNGTPAAQSYRNQTKTVLTFFDNRLSDQQMASDEEIVAKQRRIMRSEPLRLVFTGRLEKMKGADEVLGVAALLGETGREFTLDIYGAGPLLPQMKASLESANENLRRKVRILEPIDFNRELVPMLREKVDLFLCCHRQSDPSCTYLETLGCGVPILGYRNRALDGLLKLADVGWIAAPNKADLVRKILALDTRRFELATKVRNARNFALKHSFEATFERRVDQLWRLSKLPRDAC